jgi:hypothetical protein
MSSRSKLEMALTLDGTPGWFGYEKGVGHMIMSSVITLGGDHIGGNSETVEIVCASGKTLETARMVGKFTGDAQCKRCVKWSESLGYADALESATQAAAALENGPTVADMIMSDPDAVIITMDGAATVAELSESTEKPVKAKKAGKGKAKKAAKTDKPVGEVKCIANAPGLENGDGTGVCRACSWVGPMKDHDGTMVMTAHWVAGRAPKSEGLTEVKVGSEAPAAPATVDSAHKGADDMIGGARAGMLPGRTSLTRGKAMDADKVTGPKERAEGGKPVSTTMDAPLGREQTDKRSVEIPTVGGRHGFMTQDEYDNLTRTQQRRYRRQVETNKARASRAAAARRATR